MLVDLSINFFLAPEMRNPAHGRVSCLTGQGLFDGLDHVFDDLLGIAEDHHGLVHVEQFVI